MFLRTSHTKIRNDIAHVSASLLMETAMKLSDRSQLCDSDSENPFLPTTKIGERITALFNQNIYLYGK